jgi:hypothetical protein
MITQEIGFADPKLADYPGHALEVFRRFFKVISMVDLLSDSHVP